jgi:hypothetical protein
VLLGLANRCNESGLDGARHIGAVSHLRDTGGHVLVALDGAARGEVDLRRSLSAPRSRALRGAFAFLTGVRPTMDDTCWRLRVRTGRFENDPVRLTIQLRRKVQPLLEYLSEGQTVTYSVRSIAFNRRSVGAVPLGPVSAPARSEGGNIVTARSRTVSVETVGPPTGLRASRLVLPGNSRELRGPP